MKLNTKLLILTILFGIQSALQLISGILGLSDGASYGEYGNAFVQAGIMGYLAYVVYSTRAKWAYWIAVFFVGLAIFRFALGAGLIAYSGIAPSAGQTILGIVIAVLFGIVPLLILLDKEVRSAFLSARM